MALLFVLISMVYGKEADYMMLELEWKPAQCLSRTCPSAYDSNAFNIHGMWPNYNNGGYPSYCDSNYKYDVPDSLEKEMDKYWESYNGDYQYFWNHEWTKHGTCLAKPLPCPDYFQKTIDAFEALNPLEKLKAKGVEPGMSGLNVNDVYDAFDTIVNISCNKYSGVEYFSVISVCYDNDWKIEDCTKESSNCGNNFTFNKF